MVTSTADHLRKLPEIKTEFWLDYCGAFVAQRGGGSKGLLLLLKYFGHEPSIDELFSFVPICGIRGFGVTLQTAHGVALRAAAIGACMVECSCCSGTGRVQCAFCSGKGMKPVDF